MKIRTLVEIRCTDRDGVLLMVEKLRRDFAQFSHMVFSEPMRTDVGTWMTAGQISTEIPESISR